VVSYDLRYSTNKEKLEETFEGTTITDIFGEEEFLPSQAGVIKSIEVCKYWVFR